LGTYPEVSLDDARTIRDEYKKLIKQGIDPAMERIETKSQKQKEAENTFRIVAEAWLYKRELEQKQDEETIRRLKHDVYPYIGDLTFPQLTLKSLRLRSLSALLSVELCLLPNALNQT
jgi:phosphoglycolate phosphatase-like HAD superfamily hydrolase